MKSHLFVLLVCLTACAKSNTNPAAETKPAPSPEANPKPSEVMCTMDAMQCSDGSWVGRSPPSCAFNCPPAPEI